MPAPVCSLHSAHYLPKSCVHAYRALLPRGLSNRKTGNNFRATQQRACRTQKQQCAAASSDSDLWMPDHGIIAPEVMAAAAPAAASPGSGVRIEERPRTPPPDLPSLLLHNRIVFLGMPLVPAVTELIIGEILYLQYRDRIKPMFLYINSTGTSRADGETVGFETEGTAIYDTMRYVGNEIHTVCTGVAAGQSCMLLSAGHKGKRYMLENSTAMLQQPRVPPTGQRQAIEVHLKWKEVLAQKQAYLAILSETTGHSVAKLDKDMQRPLYMTPRDAIEYGVADGTVKPRKTLISDSNKTAQYDTNPVIVGRPSQHKR